MTGERAVRFAGGLLAFRIGNEEDHDRDQEEDHRGVQKERRDIAPAQRRLSAQRPDMRVLYMSGYTDNMVVHRGVLAGSAAFLQKPFTAITLAEKVRSVLDDKRNDPAK